VASLGVGAAPAQAAGAVVVTPGHSIQAALDAAAPGTTIIVRAGTYAENLAITTDGIKLVGQGAVLVPPSTPVVTACSDPDPSGDGICAVGQFDFTDPDNPVLLDPLSNVTISGFTVRGFEGFGIVFFGAENPVVT